MVGFRGAHQQYSVLLYGDSPESARPSDVQASVHLRLGGLRTTHSGVPARGPPSSKVGRLHRQHGRRSGPQEGLRQGRLRQRHAVSLLEHCRQTWMAACLRQTQVQGQRRRRHLTGGRVAAHGRQRRQGRGDPHPRGLRPLLRRAPRRRRPLPAG